MRKGVFKMTNCSKCGKEVSERAETCPHCGEIRPGESEASKKAFYIAVWAVFIFGVITVIATSF